MRDSHQPSPRPPLNSLAAKIILFAFLSTLVTALAVSWLSIQSTYTHLSRLIDQQYPAALARAGESITAWAEKAKPDSPPTAGPEVAALAALLEAQRPGLGGQMLLVDGEGHLLAAAPGAGEPVTNRIPLADLLADREDRVIEYQNADGFHVIGAARPLGYRDWHVAVEARFESAFAPVLSVVTRIFVIDLCIILLFSYLAYKITTAVVRPIETLSDGARRIAQGQFDHEIPEAKRNDEIGLLTRTFNDMMRKLRDYQNEIEAANRDLKGRNVELQQAKETFEQLSITDGLTKLHNHRFFQDHLTREIKRVNRVQEPLAMLMLDIDDFKSLNDRLGHAAGDELLVGIARIMRETVRDSDLIARYGGEEFAVITASTDRDGAYQLAEKIRTEIAENSFILDDSLRPTRITVSIGVAQFGGNRKRFFQAADRALYRAKAAGKNCVMVDEDDYII